MNRMGVWLINRIQQRCRKMIESLSQKEQKAMIEADPQSTTLVSILPVTAIPH